MRVLHFVEANHACTYYRTMLPIRQLRQDGHRDIVIQCGLDFPKDEHLQGLIRKTIPRMDAVFFSRFLDWKDIIEYANKVGVVTIYGTDDYYDFGEESPFNNIAIRNSYRDRCKDMAQMCDGVIVSTEALREAYMQDNDNVVVVSNMIDYGLKQWQKKKRKNTDKLTIGYYGSPTHYHDLKQAIPAIRRLMKQYLHLEFHYGIIPSQGMTFNLKTRLYHKEINDDNFMAVKYRQLSVGMPKERVKYLEWLPIDRYGNTYRDFDIAIAPLTQSVLNIYKSNLKILEAGAHGLPFIGSAVRPFTETIKHGVDGFLVQNEDEWYKWLKLLIDSHEWRQRLGEALYYKVRNDFDIRNRYREWEFAILSIARQSGKRFENIIKRKRYAFSK